MYLCRDLELGDREVVVKATPLSSSEASILGRLSHPNITPVYSTGFIEAYNLYYLCMPFCGRSTLTDLLDIAFQDGLPLCDESIAVAVTRWLADEQRRSPAKRWPLAAWGRCSYVDGVLSLAIQIADALELRIRITSYMAI